MNKLLIPEWVKQIEAEDEVIRLRRENKELRQALAQAKVSAEGPLFWEELLKQLSINTDAIGQLRLKGTTNADKTPMGEHHCVVTVSKGGLSPTETHTELTYSPHDNMIRCNTRESVFICEFCVLPRDSGIAVTTDFPCEPLGSLAPDKLAEIIVKRMVEIVRTEAGS